MALTNVDSGTHTITTLDTEETVEENSETGALVATINTKNLVNGETLIVRVYQKTLTGSAQDKAYEAVYQHAQDEPLKISIPMAVRGHTNGFKMTFEQSGGTARAYEWAVDKL